MRTDASSGPPGSTAACVAALLLIAAAGCADGNAPDADGDGVPAPGPVTDATTVDGPELRQVPPESIPPRPETIQDTLMIEGMPEVTTATLVRASRDADLPFSTYLPQGMSADFVTADDGAAVRFTAAFAGVVEPQAYMHVLMHPDGTSLQLARDAVSQFLRLLVPSDDPLDARRTEQVSRPAETPPWALQAHAFDYAGNAGARFVGRIILARHGPRFFHVIMHYPPEYGDGLGPRFDRILQHWRWEDTGLPLR
jgi:hypothetical protein